MQKDQLNNQDLVETYQNLNELYLIVKNHGKALEYTRLHHELKDNLFAQKSAGISKSVQKIVEEKEQIESSSQSKIRNIILAVTIATIFAGILLFRLFYKEKRKKSELIDNTQQFIKERDSQITNKEEEISKLKEQIFDNSEKVEEILDENATLKAKTLISFDEIIALAKDNSPHLYARFQEYHPKIHSKLILTNQTLKPTELTLCVYIYLGFSTKEIADYTFKSPKTIENNRSNLRKKLNVPSEESFAVWLGKLDQ